ncbi:MAG: hypothetical protein RLZZ127_2884 [Planctomycetota bacterium]
MDAALAICWRDLRAALASPLAWTTAAAWGLITGLVLSLDLYRLHGTPGAADPIIAGALGLGALLLLPVVPALTMGSFTGERQQRTLTLLLALPARPAAIALGKWLAAMGLVGLLLAVTAVQAAILSLVTDVDAAGLVAGLAGLALVGAAGAALGIWMSLVAESALTAFVLGFAGLAVWLLLGVPADREGALWQRVLAAVGLWPRIGPLLGGRLGLGDAVFCLALAGVSLSMAGAGLSSLRHGVRRVPWGTGLLAAAVAVLAVVAADRTGWRIDLSPDRRFELHPRLVEIARSAGPVEVVALWPREVDNAAGPVLDRLRSLAGAAPELRLRRIDPVLQAGERAALEESVGRVAPPAVVVRSGTRAVRLGLDGDLVRSLQRELAGALVALGDPRPPLALFTQGHGELRPGGGPEDGIDPLADQLRLAGFRVALAGPSLPPDALVVVAGPLAPFGPDLGRVAAHLRDGGGLLVLADDRAPADLARLMAATGLVLPQSGTRQPPVVVRALRRHDTGAERGLPHHRLVLLGGDSIAAHHPAARGAAQGGVSVLSPWTTPIAAEPPAQGLLWAPPGDHWLAPRTAPLDPPQDIAVLPPAALAAAVELPVQPGSLRPHGPRAVLWGSRQAAAEATLADGRWANGRLLADLAGWAARRAPPPEIPPAELRAWQVDAGDGLLAMVSALLAAILPCLLLVPAVLTWWDRRMGR